jgi:hypothetical protein
MGLGHWLLLTLAAVEMAAVEMAAVEIGCC